VKGLAWYVHWNFVLNIRCDNTSFTSRSYETTHVFGAAVVTLLASARQAYPAFASSVV
jgi:hypothetical protein